MIYSQEINKICALCQKARRQNDDEMYCEIKKQTVPPMDTACDKFSYDILKKSVKRRRRIKTDFNPEDFAL